MFIVHVYCFMWMCFVQCLLLCIVILPSMSQDLFGFKNQGINYQMYRPKYPQHLLSKCLSRLKNRNRYLDIATGTGQLLFQLSPHFNQSLGIDLSPKMIAVCQSKLSKSDNKDKVSVKTIDFMDMDQHQHKYDLITIGQALHWFPIAQTLQKSRDLLAQGGTLGVYGYILKQINLPQLQQRVQKLEEKKILQQRERKERDISELYHRFYDEKVKKNFDFDRNELHGHYGNKNRYPFEEWFADVERSVEEVGVEMEREGILRYLKTFSGYNTYLERYGDDPILEMQEQLPQGHNYTCVFDYFSILCRK